jgi:hypothetical protein
MTDADDIDTELRDAELELVALRASRQRWQSEFVNAARAKARATAKHQLRSINERIQKCEAQLRALRAKSNREGDDMRRGLIDDDVGDAGGDELVVNKSGGLTIGDKHYRHGQTVPIDELAASLNGDYLLQHRYVVRRLPRPPTKTAVAVSRAALGLADHAMMRPSDPIAELIAAVRQKQAQGVSDPLMHRSLSDLKERAIKQYGERPRREKTGAFGSGGGTVQDVGIGSLRRPTDGFDEFIYAEARKPEAVAP